MDVTSYLLGKQAGGGGTPNLQAKDVEITENGNTNVSADAGYDGLSNVGITTNVPGIVPTGTINITQNGTTDVTNYASANVNVSSSGKFTPGCGGFTFWRYGGSNATIQSTFSDLKNSIDPTNFTTMESMFAICSNLETISFENFPMDNVIRYSYIFQNCTSLTHADLSGITSSGVSADEGIYTGGMFSGCTQLLEVDLSDFEPKNWYNAYQMFQQCKKLQKIDIRKANFTNIGISTEMFGGTTNEVPANCLIIVKDNTQKAWINNNFSRLTNVKTVAEYEASQS